MKNKRVLMLLALTTVLSVSMTACNFGGGSDEDSSVVQVTPCLLYTSPSPRDTR